MKKILLFIPFVALFASCKKAATDDTTTTSSSGVRYTISVGSFANMATAKKSEGISDATVFITGEDGSIVQKTTDISGMVTVTVPTGIVAVSIKASGFTDLTYTADLTSSSDTSAHNNAGATRSAATLAYLYTLNDGTSTLSGKATGDYDTSRAGSEEIPDGIPFRAYLQPSINGINHSGAGHILSAVYTADPFEKSYNNNGYSLILPGSSDGVLFSIEPEDFASLKAAPTVKIFGTTPITYLSKSGKASIANFTYVMKP